ncbi:Putative secreted protein [Streptomyces hygroscopicus subsp. limoneus]|nr:Putative secreted protein [Streptomyces hygroscopicus subsp. limoneus]
MRSSPKRLPALLLGTALLAGALGVGTITSAAGDSREAPAAAVAHTGHVMAASTQASGDDLDGDGYIPAVPQVTGVTPSTKTPPPRYFHEFQANCSVTHTAADDPIVYPGQPGKSHDHTFMGNTSTHAGSTTASLYGGATTCKAPADASAYWMPSLYKGDQKILPVGPQTIYYKAGVTDYTSVRPFPKGLRFVVGDPMQSADQFRQHRGFVEGWECGDSYFNTDIPTSCPDRADVQLNIRFQAPSCWDGKYLDTPDHKSHMAYPVVKPGTNDNMCPDDHPVALPMIEFKMAFPVNGDMSQVHLASGRGYSFHYDFFNAWEERTLKALVDHCIVGGLQCDARGYDQTHPEAGAALNTDYRLP